MKVQKLSIVSIQNVEIETLPLLRDGKNSIPTIIRAKFPSVFHNLSVLNLQSLIATASVVVTLYKSPENMKNCPTWIKDEVLS